MGEGPAVQRRCGHQPFHLRQGVGGDELLLRQYPHVSGLRLQAVDRVHAVGDGNVPGLQVEVPASHAGHLFRQPQQPFPVLRRLADQIELQLRGGHVRKTG